MNNRDILRKLLPEADKETASRLQKLLDKPMNLNDVIASAEFQNRFGMHTRPFQEFAAYTLIMAREYTDLAVREAEKRLGNVSTTVRECDEAQKTLTSLRNVLDMDESDRNYIGAATIMRKHAQSVREDNERLNRENNTLASCLSRDQKALRDAGFILSDDLQTWKAPDWKTEIDTLKKQLEQAINDRQIDAEHAARRTQEQDIAIRAAADRLVDVTEERDDYKKRKDDAYAERNRVVAAFAKLATIMDWPVAVTRTAIDGWSEDWHGCVFIDTPQGQVSWHFHDSQADLFKALPHGPATWDGHTTPVKYERLEALVTFSPPVNLLREAMKLQDFKNLVHRRLDEMGIPKFEGEDCRIVLRLQHVENNTMPARAMLWDRTDPYHRLCIDACLETQRARGLFPKSDHLTLALAEEAGEVTKAVLDFHNGKGTMPDVRKEIVQTMAMCLRLATEGDPTMNLPATA